MVVVVWLETAVFWVVAAGELRRGLDPARLRAALREALSAAREDGGEARDPGAAGTESGTDAPAAPGPAGARSAG